jgi:[ribosomal protein S5]-alanine N-acetyltransferase
MLPHLITARLELRPATPDDLDALWALWAAPEVRRFLFDDVPVTRARAAEVLGYCLQAAEAGLGLWVARPRDAKTVIGCVGLMAASTAAQYEPHLVGAVEPLAAFVPAEWGHGYATEALAAVVRYAFEPLGLSQLAAVNDVPNGASARLLRRLGFAVTGEYEGPRYRLHTYALSREQLRPNQALHRTLDSAGKRGR